MWQYNYGYGGELYHYGVKGMRWGVRRYQNKDGSLTPEGKSRYAIAKRAKNGIIESKKGFSIHQDKIEKYMLKEGAKHSQDFFNVGYTKNDAVRLYKDIERRYDIKKATGFRQNANGSIGYSIYMDLGIIKKRTFCTAWIIDEDGATPRLTSAYRRDKRV